MPSTDRGPLPADADPWTVTPEAVAAQAPDEADDVVPPRPTTDAEFAELPVLDLPATLAAIDGTPLITAESAAILALHARFVQGGYSTPDEEARRLQADAARLPAAERQAFVDQTVAKFSDELAAAQEAKAAEPASLPIAKVRRYQELRALQNERDVETKAIKEEADQLERELVDAFTEAQTQNVNVGGKTVYLHRSVFAQRAAGVDADKVKEALLKVAPDLVTTTVNANTLSAWIREYDDDDRELPSEIQGVLEVGERFSVRIIAGGSKAKSKTHSK